MYKIETEIDIEADAIGNPSDPDYFENNIGEGEMFQMGP